MAEQKKDGDKKEFTESNYTFIQETIRPKKRSKWRRIWFTAFLACIFGGVSSIVFCISLPFVSKVFHIDRKVVTLYTPEETETPAPTIPSEASASPTVSPTPKPTVTPKPTSSVIVQKQPSDITDYSSMYRDLKEITRTVNKSIVTITSVKNGVDVFNNPSENTNSTSGIIIANNGKELLMFVNNQRIESANYLKATFQEGTTVNASLYSMHRELGIAIVAVELADIPTTVLQVIEVVNFGDSRTQVAGDPVIVLGNPNGYMYSVEYGVVSNAIYSAYFIDGKVDLINTTIPYNENGEGILVNLQGQVIGFITNQAKFKNDLNKNISTCIGITKLKPIIEHLVNNTPLVYFGILGNDVTTEIATKIGVSAGIYVMEVQAESPAYEAGFKKGDVITHVGGEEIKNMTEFYDILTTHAPNKEITVSYIRKNGEENVSMEASVILSTLK